MPVGEVVEKTSLWEAPTTCLPFYLRKHSKTDTEPDRKLPRRSRCSPRPGKPCPGGQTQPPQAHELTTPAFTGRSGNHQKEQNTSEP